LPHGNVFHAGDGNLHPLLLCDSRDTEQMHRVEQAAWEIMEACVRLGGTISGEHGIGVEKQDAMRMVFSPDDLDFQQDLKNAFDPQNVLNPGKIFPKPETDHQQREFRHGTGNGGAALNALVQKIKTAHADGQAILPVGCGSRQDYGNLGTVAVSPLDSTGLDEIIDYDPPNQVVTAGAGMTLENLQIELKRHNQWLPLRPLFATNEHSLGGLAATGACGPERMVYGALRDHLLGLRFINGKGQLISAGGRVVKNVAGYDITRLMTASAGTLGFITELTLKVATIPERCCALTVQGPLDACSQAAGDIIKSNLWPIYVAAAPVGYLNVDEPVDHWQVSIGFEGLEQTVESQLQRTAKLLKDGALHSINTETYDLIEGKFGQPARALNQSRFALRADFPIDCVVEFYEAAKALISIRHALLDFGNGRMTAGVDEITDDAWHQMNEVAAELDGHVLLEKAPDDFRQNNDVFGRFRPEWEVMHTLKSVLDPGNVFTPGRLPGKR
jgi:FAD/FMN-containing dehydrogenase